MRTCRAFACFVLQIPSLVLSAPDQPDAVRAAFDLLEKGWTVAHPTSVL